MASLVRTGLRLSVTVALAAVAAALAGCATAPSGGPPRPAPAGNDQVQAYVQPLPPPGPTNKWLPQNVVLGFLHASASYAFDPAAARQYLMPELRRTWHPGRGVTVIGDIPAATPLSYNPKQSLGGGPPVQQKWVHLTGPQVATLSQSGQYQYAPGPVSAEFLLEKNPNGVWLIEQLPQQSLKTLMLTESEFQEVYQPRNLFFFAPAPGSQTPSVLVPGPVYAPLQSSNSALNTDLATGLVNGLLKGQGGWLTGATISEFPAGTRLLKKVTITGKTAQVDLGGAAARASQQWMLMADQLAATLGDGTYAPPLATHVQLSINNRLEYSTGAPDLVPTVPSGPVDLITGTSSVGQLTEPVHGAKLQQKLDQHQIGSAAVTAVAASPSPDHLGQLAVAVRNADGCAVEEQPTGQGAYKTYRLSTSGGQCSSLSYDANGNLWAAAGSGVWVLPPGTESLPIAVDLSAMSGATQPGDRILAMQMAPDAVRVALLVSTSAGNRLLLAAAHVQGGSASFGESVTVGTTGLTDPQAISWYDAYHLAVLATGGIYEVPLTGGAGQQPAPQLISTAPSGVQTKTLATDGTELVVGTSQGQVQAKAVSSTGDWSIVTNGADPVYPG